MVGPAVSVVMSVFNSNRHLDAAIESILDQTMSDFEFIIVDDASTDDSSETLRKHASRDQRIRIHRNEKNQGLTKSLNIALAQTTAPLIARQDADDISEPPRFERQVECLTEDPALLAVGSNYQTIDDEDNKINDIAVPSDTDEIAWQMLFHNAFCHSAMMFRREDPSGKPITYNEEYRYSQDFELWSRVSQMGRITNIGETLVQRRVSPNSISTKKKIEQQSFARKIAWRNIRRVAPVVALSLFDDTQLESLREVFHLGFRGDERFANRLTAFKLLVLWYSFVRRSPERAEHKQTWETFWNRMGKKQVPSRARDVAFDFLENQHRFRFFIGAVRSQFFEMEQNPHNSHQESINDR